MKHTPGPWTFSENEQYGSTRFYVSQQEGAPYTPNYSDAATLIAETCNGEYLSIQRANASLIAAAPELLDALIKAEKKLCEYEHYVSGGDDEVNVENEILMARAAIAKATGEQP